MAKDKKEETDTEEEGTEGGGGKKKLIIMIVGALLLVGGAVGGTLFFVGGSEAPEEVVDAEPPEPEKDDPSYIELKPFTVNLNPEDPVGFLQVSIQILTFFDPVAEELEKHKPLIRNNLTLLFGEQKSVDLRSPEGKQMLQQKVHTSIQEIIDKYGSGGEVDNVFFTNFVMQ